VIKIINWTDKMNIKIIMTIVSLIFALSACGGSKTTTENSTGKTQYKLRNTTNLNTFEATLKKLMLATYGKIALPITIYTDSVENIKSGGSGHSTTNTQENRVDEADRLKNDDTYLYVASITTPTINVYTTKNGTSNARLTATVAVGDKDTANISGLYLTENKLVALSGQSGYFGKQWFDSYFWSDRVTELTLFDVSDGKLSKDIDLKIEGQLISSRRIDSTLYLTTRYTPTLSGLVPYPENEKQVATNRALIEAATLSDLLPDYSVNNLEKGDIVAAENCFTTEYSDNTNQQVSLINVISIDLEQTSAKPKGSCFVGSVEALYMSAQSLYLATTQYQYQNDNGNAHYKTNISTDIHKLSLQNGRINYKGSAQVAGHLGWKQELKSFRMGEFGNSNEVFGIITYTGNQQSLLKSPATFFTLSEDYNKENSLKILAQLPNSKHPQALGKPDEQIYATRFLGDKAYLVTFKTTDPLYILDLSDPTDPSVIGELKINGYSDYLHPIGENLILGIGKDAVPISTGVEDDRNASYQGVKISLLDVSNPKKPYERNQLIIGKRGTNSAISVTQHAFTSRLQPNGDIRVALPISVHINAYPSENDSLNSIHEWQYDALFRYDIDTFTGALYPLESIKITDIAPNINSQRWQYDRSAIIGNKVYYLHGDDIISRDW
jgi:uncharacterized secreted protein with C-terminal beta-propeller domain